MEHGLDARTLSAHKFENALHTVIILAAIGVLIASCAVLLVGIAGVGWAFVTVGLMLVLLPRFPPALVMRAYRGRFVAPEQGGQLTGLVAALAQRAQLPAVPALYVLPSMTLNAFAVGRPGDAAIAITEGLLRRLTMREIAGILGHEMSHVASNDLWVMSLADIMGRLTLGMSYAGIALAILNIFGQFQGEQYAAWWVIALLYLSPTLASLLQLALSRTREFEADAEGARLTGDPMGLASALHRLERYTGEFWEDLMLPVPARRIPYPSLLRSHPPTKDRVARLIELSHEPMQPAITVPEEPLISLVGFGPVEMRPRYRLPAGYWF